MVCWIKALVRFALIWKKWGKVFQTDSIHNSTIISNHRSIFLIYIYMYIITLFIIILGNCTIYMHACIHTHISTSDIMKNGGISFLSKKLLCARGVWETQHCFDFMRLCRICIIWHKSYRGWQKHSNCHIWVTTIELTIFTWPRWAIAKARVSRTIVSKERESWYDVDEKSKPKLSCGCDDTIRFHLN